MLTPNQAFNIIEQYGLSIKQIPKTNEGTYDAMHRDRMIKHKKESETIGEPYERILSNGKMRLFFDVISTPKNAGIWLCKKSEYSTQVPWFWEDAYRSDSLTGCIQLFLDNEMKGSKP